MGAATLRFKLGPVPVTVEPTFFAVTVLLAASRLEQPSALLVWIAAALLSVLVHELGHAVAASAFGVQARISLHGCGGTTSHAPLAGDLDQQSFERHGDPVFAYNAACAMARSGNADAAMALLVRAVAAGWSDFDALDRDEDLSALKQRPDWAALHRGRSGS